MKSSSGGDQGVVQQLTNVVRWLSDSMLGSKERQYYENLLLLLKRSTIFRLCSDENREKIAAKMIPVRFKRGDVLQIQGDSQRQAFVIVEGTVVRKRLVEGRLHTVGPLGYAGSSNSIGMLHLLQEEPSHTTVQALSDGYAFVLDSAIFQDMIDEDQEVAQQVIHSLVVELRQQSYVERTPLFLQQGTDIKQDTLNWFAVSVAASIESFYRSGLNAILLSQLTGKPAAWFPNMHIQLPSRIAYINGFKGLRYIFDQQLDPRDYSYPQLAGMALAVTPGVVMTPVSSVLEACNVTHMNNEPLMLRWTRGLIPRCGREVVFGIGINQLSDYCEERYDNLFTNSTAKNIAGSLTAGAVAGYLSHIPHNLSMLKLCDPKKSYVEHFANLKQPYEKWWDSNLAKKPASGASGGFARTAVSSALTVLFPKGCLVRTAQISGSFIIINSAINALKHINVNVTMDKTEGVV